MVDRESTHPPWLFWRLNNPSHSPCHSAHSSSLCLLFLARISRSPGLSPTNPDTIELYRPHRSIGPSVPTPLPGFPDLQRNAPRPARSSSNCLCISTCRPSYPAWVQRWATSPRGSRTSGMPSSTLGSRSSSGSDRGGTSRRSRIRLAKWVDAIDLPHRLHRLTLHSPLSTLHSTLYTIHSTLSTFRLLDRPHLLSDHEVPELTGTRSSSSPAATLVQGTSPPDRSITPARRSTSHAETSPKRSTRSSGSRRRRNRNRRQSMAPGSWCISIWI